MILYYIISTIYNMIKSDSNKNIDKYVELYSSEDHDSSHFDVNKHIVLR